MLITQHYSVVRNAQHAQQTQHRLFNLRSLKKFDLVPKTLTNVYRCTVSVWVHCITSWQGIFLNHRALQRVVQSSQRITGGTLPALQDIYSTWCHRKAKKIIKDPSHRQYRCINVGTCYVCSLYNDKPGHRFNYWSSSGCLHNYKIYLYSGLWHCSIQYFLILLFLGRICVNCFVLIGITELLKQSISLHLQ